MQSIGTLSMRTKIQISVRGRKHGLMDAALSGAVSRMRSSISSSISSISSSICAGCVNDVPSNSVRAKCTAAATMAILLLKGVKSRVTKSVPFVLLWVLLRMAEPGRRCHQPPWGSGQGGGKTPGQACGCRGDLHSPGAPPRPGPHCRLLQPARFLELELACCDVGPNFLAHQEQSPSAVQLSESAVASARKL